MGEFGPVAEPVFQLLAMDIASPDAGPILDRLMLSARGRGFSREYLTCRSV